LGLLVSGRAIRRFAGRNLVTTRGCSGSCLPLGAGKPPRETGGFADARDSCPQSRDSACLTRRLDRETVEALPRVGGRCLLGHWLIFRPISQDTAERGAHLWREHSPCEERDGTLGLHELARVRIAINSPGDSAHGRHFAGDRGCQDNPAAPELTVFHDNTNHHLSCELPSSQIDHGLIGLNGPCAWAVWAPIVVSGAETRKHSRKAKQFEPSPTFSRMSPHSAEHEHAACTLLVEQGLPGEPRRQTNDLISCANIPHGNR